MDSGDPLSNREAQTSAIAASAGHVTAIKSFKYVIYVLRGDPDPGARVASARFPRGAASA